MAYLIDTSIAIHVRDGTEPVLQKVYEHEGFVLMSALSLAELQRGLFKRLDETVVRQTRLAKMLTYIPVLDFTTSAAENYGRILAQCGWAKGRDFDRMIAGHALSIQAVLVTDNESDFRDIPGLSVENWKH